MKKHILIILDLFVISCANKAVDYTVTENKIDQPDVQKSYEGSSGKPPNHADIKSKIQNSKFPVEKLFGVWALDLLGPVADFQLNANSYFIPDFDGDGDMPYAITGVVLLFIFLAAYPEV